MFTISAAINEWLQEEEKKNEKRHISKKIIIKKKKDLSFWNLIRFISIPFASIHNNT